MLTTMDVACLVGGSFILFLCPEILFKKEKIDREIKRYEGNEILKNNSQII